MTEHAFTFTLTGQAASTVERYAREQGWTPAEALSSILSQADDLLDMGLLAPEVEEGYDAKADADAQGVAQVRYVDPCPCGCCGPDDVCFCDGACCDCNAE